MKTAFILGNGVSRKPVNLNGLVGQGTIFGCNALYREFDNYDYLISIDPTFQAIIESYASYLEFNNYDYLSSINPKFQAIIERLDEAMGKDDRIIFPPQDECWESIEYSPNRRRSNAGMNAMLEAIRREHDKLYCLGFDFLLNDPVASTDNIFKGQEGYGPETHANANDNVHRVRYLEWFMRKYSLVNFVFVLPDNANFTALTAKNVTGMYVSKFKEKFNA